MTILELIGAPLAQDPAYHLFADHRSLLGIPNFWNVASNLPFLIVGVLGIREVSHHRADPLYMAWLIFFAGIVLTTFGSGYFHLAPDNESLAWDRLTMTIGIMGLVSIVIGEYLSVPWARRLLVPLLVVGAGSVAYWIRGEALGAGDLRPYAAVQFLPMLLIPLVALARRTHSDLGQYIGWLIGCYVAAKLFEHFDAEVFAAGEILSGHSFKHALAALAPLGLIVALRRRRHARS